MGFAYVIKKIMTSIQMTVEMCMYSEECVISKKYSVNHNKKKKKKITYICMSINITIFLYMYVCESVIITL